MRQRRDAGLVKERGTGKIAQIIFEPMVAERRNDCLLIDDRVARKIQQ